MSQKRGHSMAHLTILFFVFIFLLSTPVQTQAEEDTVLPDCEFSGAAEYQDLPLELAHLTQPKLNIPIPGFTFRKQVFKIQRCIDPITNKEVVEKAKTTFVISALCDYMQALFKLAVGFAILLAVIVIMHNGLRWAASAGSATAISEAKNGISNALVGLLLLLGGVLLLRIINPDLVICRPFMIEKPKLPDASLVSVSSIPSDLIIISSANTADTLAKDVQEALVVGLKKIQDKDNPWGATWGSEKKPTLADASRSVSKQLQMYVDNCVFPDGQRSASFRCNGTGDSPETLTSKPWRGAPYGFQDIANGIAGTSNADISTLTRDAVFSYIAQNAKLDPSTSPHTSGVAVDLWAPGVTKSVLHTPDALARQKLLITYMLNNGFCVLTGKPDPTGVHQNGWSMINENIEHWHFELNVRRKSRPEACVTDYKPPPGFE